jgi:cytochrome c-type biogenesis protein CcmE
MDETRDDETKATSESSATQAPSDGGEAEGMSVPRRRRRPEDESPQSSRKGLMIVIPLLMVGAAMVALVFTGIEDKGIYSKPVDQLMASKGKFAGRPVRADGILVKGSLEKRESPCESRFVIERGGTRMPVSFKQCVVPDTFRDVPNVNVEVTVEGKLQKDDSFEATQVIAKCPSKYEMQEKAAKGEKMPHAPASM